MEVLPKAKHLAFVATICMLGGLYPAQLLLGNKFVQNVYKMYINFLKLLLLLCLMSSYTQLYILLSAEKLEFEEILQNISISLLFVMLTLRQVLIRISPDVPSRLTEIGNAELRWKEQEDFQVLKIFETETKLFKTHFLIYFVVLIVAPVEYILLTIYYQGTSFGNEMDIKRPYLMSLWFPFDQQVYYWETFCISSFIVGMMVVSQMTTDVLFFCFIRHPVVQLQILHHYFKHFEYYSKQLELELGKVDEVTTHILWLKKCIKMHWDIIDFVHTVNKNFSSMMFMDYVQSSFRITTLVCVAGKINATGLIFVIYIMSFLSITFIREYYMYDSGSDIIFLSTELGYLAFETNWYEKSHRFKLMLQFFILRTQKPLKLLIGSFADLSLAALVSIIRTTYTYLSIIIGFDG